LFVGLFPILLYIANTQAAFQAKYPLSRGIISSDGSIPLLWFLIYEILYFLIFLSGETFWRGYLTFGTERDLGIYGIMLMCVPYTMAHFGKPLPEALGAIAAGVTLGWLALKHRSVWIGVGLHYAVALSMDLMSMRINGFWIGFR
jgi:membrane protease YdiL (CAAX protease family)